MWLSVPILCTMFSQSRIVCTKQRWKCERKQFLCRQGFSSTYCILYTLVRLHNVMYIQVWLCRSLYYPARFQILELQGEYGITLRQQCLSLYDTQHIGYIGNNTLEIFIKCAEAWAFLVLPYVKANLLTKYKHDQHNKTD